MAVIRLGLIGADIAASQSPRLHTTAGRLCGVEVSYDLLIPALLGQAFEEVFERCRREAYRGLNITYPFKERVMTHVRMIDPRQAAIGACNTVVFHAVSANGANTDCSGFLQAFSNTFQRAAPGHVAIAGAGGVGKAIAFALGLLGANSLSLFDTDVARAEALKRSLEQAFKKLPVRLAPSIEDAAATADGLVNCTPLGMSSSGTTAFPGGLLGRQKWAFDAVYTPVDTPFMQAARAAGLETMSGYELFLYQGIDAFRIFTGFDVGAAALRKALQQQHA